MLPPAYITLSQALSWLAFAKRKDQKELRTALTFGSIQLSANQAISRCEVALDALVTAAHAGKIELQGKHNSTGDRSSTATTVQIPPIALADYRAFDITTDGLRKGTGLLWLGIDVSQDIEQAKGAHFSDVKVKVTDLQKHLRPLCPAPRLPRVAIATLKNWYDGLPPITSALPIVELWDLAKTQFPKNSVPRRAVEALCGPRQRGRPKKSP